MLRAAGLIAALGFFPFLWNLLGFINSGFSSPLAIVTENQFLNSPPSTYGKGSWATFILGSWRIHGAVVLPFLLAGIATSWWRGVRLLPAYLVAFYAVHSVLWANGWCRTAGYLRFFASIAPFAALVAVEGCRLLVSSFTARFRFPAGILGTVLVLLSLGWCLVEVVMEDRRTGAAYAAVARAVEVAQETDAPSAGRPMLAAAMLPKLMLHSTAADPPRLAPLNPKTLASAPPGTWILFAGFDDDPGHSVPITHFYSEAERSPLTDRIERRRPYVHLLKEVASGFVEVADFSLYCRDATTPEEERWPYVVKLFRTAGPQ
jgi:hypothetical protein